MKSVDYQQAPLLVIWEVTRACALACVHCRASAMDVRDSRELSLEEGKRLIDEVAGMGTPLMVLTGGDPLQRSDLEALIRHGKQAGLVMATIPAATPRLTQERIQSLRDAGVDQLALSLDGETAVKHDSFRQVEGTYDKVLQAASWIRDAGVPLQINSVLGSWNYQDFSKLAQTVTDLGAIFWEIFFLVPTGRGSELTSCTPQQYEELFGQIHELSLTAPFTVKVTEGQHYRRWFAQNDDVERRSSFQHHQRLVAPRPVNAGSGFAFVDHTGEVCPSGFLPLACGNVRDVPLSGVYRHHPTFRQLRDLSLLQGKCGICDFRDFCSGGSRARAYGVTGNFLASEPFCAYEPQKL
jgi:radical SAM protein